MPFRTYTITIIIIVVSIFAVNTSDAGTASEVFQKTRSKVLAQDITFYNNYVFSKGTAFPATDSTNSIIYAKRKAKHRAFLILSKYLVTPTLNADVDLPDFLSNKLAVKLQQELIKSTGSKLIKVSGVSKVYSNFDGTRATVVIGVRQQEIEHLKTSERVDYNKLLKDSICVRNSEFNPFLAYEICPEEDQASLVMSIYSHLSRNFGNNVAKTINSDPIENFFGIWQNQYEYKDNLNYSTLNNLTLDEVLFFLDAMPYDPLISYTAGEKFRQSGFIKTACLFNKAGTKLFFSENTLCLNYDHLVSSKASDSGTEYQFFRTVSPTISEADSTSNIQFPYEAEFIIKSLGTIPCTETKSISKLYYMGNSLFQNKDFEKALNLYFQALEDTLTADLLNMIGMTLLRLNNHKLAIPFLRQALYFNPHHKFAGVNLTEAFLNSNFKELAIASYESTLKNGNIDEWGAYKLKTLKGML